jgi:GNAT superfamily N-acetyltransferase
VNDSSRPAFEIRPMDDRKQLVELLRLRWPDSTLIICGQFIQPEDVEGLGYYANDRLHGIATWRAHGKTMHIVAVNAFTELRGVGVALIDAMIAYGRENGMALLRATISNDNTVALRFYQRRGFHLSALHRGLYDAMRAMKPAIPVTGLDGIPMRDELELEFEL